MSCLNPTKMATDRLITAPSTCCGCTGELTFEQLEESKSQTNDVKIRNLARQSLALRGDWNLESKTEVDSNFFQLLKLRSGDDEELASWLGQKSSKYLSAEMPK